jgi:threonyl-tRNA synthetase
VDIDEREDTVGKRIREAGREWVPYVVVIGDKELETGRINVTIREESQANRPKTMEMSPEELDSRIQAQTAGLPFRPIPLAKMLSLRPKFI